MSRVLTESYRDKRYEEDLTRLFFQVNRELSQAIQTPCLEYIRMAYSSIAAFAESVVYSKEHLERYSQKIQPVLNDIERILYGDPRTRIVAETAIKYNARISRYRGEAVIHNGNNIITQLRQVLFLVKQWAYEQGLLLVKPIDRKYGLDAISDTFEQ